LLTIRLLGELQAQYDGRDLPDLRLCSADRLLAILALRSGRPIRNTLVAEMLWPDTGSLNSLRKANEYLRKALGPQSGRLRTEKGVLHLDLSDAEIDVATFDALCVQDDTASGLAAVELYRDRLLKGWDDSWVLAEREARDLPYRDIINKLLKILQSREQWVAAAQLLTRALAVYPNHEDWWVGLMTVQANSGARLEGLSTGRRYLKHLEWTNRVEGLDIQPSPIIVKLMQQLELATGPIAPDLLPALAAYETVGGASPLTSRFYVERREDSEAHFAIAQRESIVSIRGARQTGKSSLLARALHRARQNGTIFLRTEWQKLTSEDLETPAAFYRTQAQSLAAQLQLKIDHANLFCGSSAPAHEFEWFLRDQLFAAVEADAPILWAIDDADRLFSCPFRDDVFALFRSWHNERAYDEAGPWRRFTLVLAYAAEAHLAIRDLNRSPFNVGTRVTLGDFTQAQLGALNARYGSPLDEAEVGRLYDLVGGHPYLVRRALHEVTTRQTPLDAIVAAAIHNGGIFADHLYRMLESLRADADLCANLRRLLAGDSPPEDSSMRLCAAGLLVWDETGGLRARCRLYDLFLRRRLL
jgi:DNA-binding SARP family transcriptional activator